MKTLTYLIAIYCLLIGLPCQAQTDSIENIYTWNHRITKKEFVQKYGTDDTSRALIEMFYQKRRGIIAPAIVIFAGLALISSNPDKVTQQMEIGVGSLTVIAILNAYSTWDRRTLLILIKDHQHKIPLPERYQSMVRAYMQNHHIKTYK